MTASLHFLLRFVAASSLGMGLWLWCGVDYLGLVTPAVNILALWLDAPFQLMLEGERVLYAYYPVEGRSFRVMATGQESIYLNLVPFGAVFAAIPGRSASWRLGWAGVALGLLWMSHISSFYVGGHVALWQFAQSGPQALSLAQPLAPWLPASRGQLYLDVLRTWNLWGRYGLCVLMWIVANAQPVPSTVSVVRPAVWRLRHWTLRPSTT